MLSNSLSSIQPLSKWCRHSDRMTKSIVQFLNCSGHIRAQRHVVSLKICVQIAMGSLCPHCPNCNLTQAAPAHTLACTGSYNSPCSQILLQSFVV
ncbi:hypothetical protein TNCV_4799921 [Trichonephila clavipes]|uniref:Uncharacterized protein n=1 Tax=Trichonephila clavipes TaxID=2585209 RepID=A0A8X6RHH6_TRICX|nr:hypothetical protein TNCV_4799921 [Trichonephila clavipes]